MAILETRKELNASEQRDRLESLLEELQINHIRDSLGIALSGGERRRVEIARALAADPGFILLDEPFAGVDPISIIDIQRIITHLKDRNIGVLITDHNVRETLGICDRAYILSNGSLIAEGSPAEVLQIFRRQLQNLANSLQNQTLVRCLRTEFGDHDRRKPHTCWNRRRQFNKFVIFGI